MQAEMVRMCWEKLERDPLASRACCQRISRGLQMVWCIIQIATSLVQKIGQATMLDFGIEKIAIFVYSSRKSSLRVV
jgi:hypothetical protein